MVFFRKGRHLPFDSVFDGCGDARVADCEIVKVRPFITVRVVPVTIAAALSKET
jgi:hypothetical protein